jgi:hypothetical protein
MSRVKLAALRLSAVLAILISLTGCSLIGRTAGILAALAPAALSILPIKFLFSCIPEGTLVDTPTGARPIEALLPGDDVIGFDGTPIRVLQIHAYVEDPAAERFYQINFESGAEVRLCDMHRIGGVRAKDVEPGDQFDGQIVQSIEIFGGVVRSYDLLTEDAGYRISGLPVNSMIEEMAAAARDGVDSIRD